MSDLDIAIVGMSGAFPGAADIEQFWKNLAAGKCSLERYTELELEQAGISPGDFRRENYVRVGGRVGDVDLFDNDFFGISNRDAELMDPQHRRFFQYAWKAFEHAGYDVSRFKGRIGVYAGISLNTYLTTVLLRSSAINLERDGQSMIFGNLSDYVTTRLSYLLDLKGPSINVQTACSTSLVAVHEACQGLLSYQSDMALAGGCSLTVPDTRGYIYHKDSFFSPDGAVRAFDEKAAGTVFTNGIGLVVLKRRADAERDGDHIYAILKGVAINNDGADKVGYAAPSISGQSRAIRDALELSDVRPDDIEYIETHGTGTELGDPVEVSALTDAFRADTGKKQFCALGSVKTNIGHTDVAAGAAGLIKAALSLHHKVLPASLNYEKPNPRLELASSPFYVNAQTRSWETKKEKRHAGVSSFGIGGTNAHAILEEAPAYVARPGTRPAYCLTLSARTPESLRALVERYRAFLAESPRFSWADICFTSNQGRKAFAHRQVVVASDAAGALAQLEAGKLTPSEVRHRKLVVRAAEGEAEALGAWLREAAPEAHQALAGVGAELGQATLAYVVQRLRAYGVDARPASALRLSSAALEKLRALPGLEAGEAAAAEAGAADCVLVLGREPLFQCEGVEVRPSQLAAKEGVFTALLGLAWKHGASIDWGRFHGDERRTRVPLPTYEFARKRHWVSAGPAIQGEDTSSAKIHDINQWFYKPVWRESATPVRAGHGLEGSTVLVLGPDRESFRTSTLLKGARVIHVMPGNELKALGGDVYTLNPTDENGYRQLLEELQRQNALPRYVLHTWLVDRHAWKQDVSDFQSCQERGLYSLMFLVRQFGRLGLGEQKLSVIVAASGLVNVSGSEELNPNKSPVLGATRTLPKEYTSVECRAVDVSSQDLLENPRAFLRVVAEFHEPLKPENEVVAIRAGHRWRPFYERIQVPTEACTNPVLTTGAYVLFGGLGEFGLNLAAYLADRAKVNLVLAGSSKFVERSGWEAWVAEHGPKHSWSQKIELLKELEAKGARLDIVQCDLTDEALVHRTLERVREQYGAINAIVHAAGVVENGMIDRKDVRQIDSVFKAKVHGTYTLLNYVKQGRVPKLILASSMNSIIGGLGQIDNTATNAFIDTIATTPFVQALGDVTAINWGAVNTERAARANVLPQFADLSREHKKNYMSDQEIYDVYDRLLSWTFGPRLVVSTIDFAQVLERWGEVSRVTELSRLRQVASDVAASKKANVEYRSKVHQFVAESWSGILGVQELGWDSNLFDLGAHSLGAVQFVSMLKDSYGVSLHAMNVYEFQKLGVLVEYVEKLVQEKEAKALINRSGR
jgi:acyl transferase domain-containing protein/acyl carrier protein